MSQDKPGKKTVLEVSIDGLSVDLTDSDFKKLRELFTKDIKSVLESKKPALSAMISSLDVEKKPPS